jgi:hypothetical protein
MGGSFVLTIDGNGFRRFIINGANRLLENKSSVDAMNVFPVPDGDTGTNMSMTIASAAKAVSATTSDNISEVAKAAANGALRGARGNSGVILSQILRGFYRGVNGKVSINATELGAAFSSAADEAYKAVMKPKEGTMLTVIRAMGDRAVELSYDNEDIEAVLKGMIEYAELVLAKTPDMLPQLKQAGVVDSGGQGLVHIVSGGYENIGIDNEVGTGDASESKTEAVSAVAGGVGAAAVQGEIKFGYCTEFFITGKDITDESVEELRVFLNEWGDSIVLVRDEELVKVHVHSNHPGKMLEKALIIGQLESIKVENMRLQHTSLVVESEAKAAEQDERAEFGIVVVSSGDGIDATFKELGASCIIKGGQTMNPSTEDVLGAIDSVNADNIFILPNNKNIIMVAEQAKELAENSKVYVVPTRSIPQGVAAMVGFLPDMSAEENEEAMNEAIATVKTGEVTVAVRDTVVNDIEIKEGNFIALLDDDIVLAKNDRYSCAKELLDRLIEADEDACSVTIYYGEDVNAEEAEELLEYAQQGYEELDVELIEGGQSVYSYIIGVE